MEMFIPEPELVKSQSKSSALQKEEPLKEMTLKEHGIDDDDVRYILLAQKVESLSLEWRDNKPLTGKEFDKKVYDRFGIPRILCLVLLLVMIIFTKPQWCKNLKGEIDEQCKEKSSDNTVYYRSVLVLFDTGMDPLITSLCLIFLSVSKYYRLQITEQTSELYMSTILCVLLCVLYILVVLIQFLDIAKLPYNDIVVMAFILVYTYINYSP